MSLPQIADETFVSAPLVAVRRAVCDERTWARWFPRLRLRCVRDRGREGKRWELGGELAGTAEIWLELFGDGVIVHAYLRPESTVERGRRAQLRLVGAYGLSLKAHLREVKDELELGRRPGEPSLGSGGGE